MDGSKIVVFAAALVLVALAAGVLVGWLVFRPKTAKPLPPKKNQPPARQLKDSVPWDCSCGQTNRAGTKFCRKCGKANVPSHPARRVDQSGAEAARRVLNAAQSAQNHTAPGWPCPFCGRINRPESHHCANCGKRNEGHFKTCSKCGEKVLKGKKFCNKCGQAV